MSYSFGFIGCGNMGGALAAAAARSGDPHSIALCDSDDQKARSVAGDTGMEVTDAASIAEKARFVVMGVKPQVLRACLSSISPVLRARRDEYVLVSMAAGVTIASITEMLGFDCPIIRIMPNTPAFVGEGMILCCKNGAASDAEMSDFLRGMSAAGTFDEIPEGLIDAGCALSGCGPAFVYMFIEALADGAVAAGLPRDKAYLYGCQTLIGSARMVMETGVHPAKLKDAVCSPGGSTIAGVRALDEKGFRAAAEAAVAEAFRRTVELGKA